MAAASAPLVGVLAEKWFGFSGDAKVTGDLAKNLRNAGAIGSALLAFTTSEALGLDLAARLGGVFADRQGLVGRGGAGGALVAERGCASQPSQSASAKVPPPQLRPPPPPSLAPPSCPPPPSPVPWAFCAFVYSGLHVTYPRDRRRALERQRGTDERAAREYEFEADGGCRPRVASARRASERMRIVASAGVPRCDRGACSPGCSNWRARDLGAHSLRSQFSALLRHIHRVPVPLPPPSHPGLLPAPQKTGWRRRSR